LVYEISKLMIIVCVQHDMALFIYGGLAQKHEISMI
jgi:hypothetical protein